MFEIAAPTTATLDSVTPRTERHGDEHVFAISLGLTAALPNRLLEAIAPGLLVSLYVPDDEQPTLDGVEKIASKRRVRDVDEVKLATKLEGWTLKVEHGLAGVIELSSCRVDKLRVTPLEGGSCKVQFRVSTTDINPERCGLLCAKIGDEVTVGLLAPTLDDDAAPPSGDA